jgi:hypothetical protein
LVLSVSPAIAGRCFAAVVPFALALVFALVLAFPFALAFAFAVAGGCADADALVTSRGGVAECAQLGDGDNTVPMPMIALRASENE